MLDLCADAGLGVLDFFEQPTPRRVRQDLALARLDRDMPGHRLAQIFFSLGHALIAGITKDIRFFAMQAGVRLRHVAHVGGCRHDGMRQSRLGINTDMGLHAEEPLIALLRLVHFRIALAILILRRARRVDQRGIDNRALPQQ